MGKSKRFENNIQWELEFILEESYHTRSNKTRHVRTPGGKLVAQYVAKTAHRPRNAMVTSQKKLGGLKAMRPQSYRRADKTSRRISRAYGGVFDHSEVKNRIVRTFLTEEVKNVKKTMAMQASAEAKTKKKGKKT